MSHLNDPIKDGTSSVTPKSSYIEGDQQKISLKKPRICGNDVTMEEEIENEKKFDQCLALLIQKDSIEKIMSGVVLLVRLFDLNELSPEQVKKLIKAVGIEKIQLLIRMPTPESIPPNTYRLPAINILMCYIPYCHGDPLLYKCLPILSEIIFARHKGDSSLIQEAYACISLFASETVGRQALVDYEIIGSLVTHVAMQTEHSEYALLILRQCACDLGSHTWEEEQDAFEILMISLSKRFASEQDCKSFDVCDALRDFLPSIPERYISTSMTIKWRKNFLMGLHNIVVSKLSIEFRKRSLLLASVIIDIFGIPAFVADFVDGAKLFVLVVSLACGEVRLSLEDQTIDEIISSSVSTTCCYSIMENGIEFLIKGADCLEDDHKQVLYKALKEGFNSVLNFLSEMASDTPNEKINGQMFIHATVRVLAAWMAEETSANRLEIYKLLPFLMELVSQNFNERKQTRKLKKQDSKKGTPDLLKFLLPGMCHLTAEDVPCEILLGLNLESLLVEYLFSQWNKACAGNNTVRGEKFEEVSDSIITTCNIFMNIVVQEPDRVKSSPEYYRLLRWHISKVPEIPQGSQNLHINGCLCTLGLLILRYQGAEIPKNETGTFKFIQSVVRFLWDAYNVEESPDYSTLVVSSSYKPIWDELIDFWFISIHSISVLIGKIPWLTEFLIESEWPQSLLGILLLVKSDGLEESLKASYEDLFCALVQSGSSVPSLFTLKGADIVCEKHEMRNLQRLLKT